MWIYAALFVFPAAWVAAAGRSGNGRPGKAAVLVTALILAVLIGLRFRVGGDWHSYWLMLERAHNLDWATALTISDPAYMGLNIVAARLGFSIAFVNLACAVLAVAGTFAFALRQNRPWLALLAAVPVLLAVTAMTTTRQSAAIGLELLALGWFLDGRRGLPIFALLLACAFHWSSAVLLPIVPLLLARPENRARIGWGLVALAFAAAAAVWLRAEPGIPAAGGLFRLLPSLIAAGAIVFLRRKAMLAEGAAAIAFYLAGLALLCLAQLPVSSLNADRLGLYTIALQMLVLPRLPDMFAAPAMRRTAIASLVFLYGAMFAAWAMLSPYAGCMTPYRSYLQEPNRLIAREVPEPVC
ncbi:MAG TPA: EpsG family protein [Allosphingosinicella sp.]